MKVKIIFKDQNIGDKILDGYLAELVTDPQFICVVNGADEITYHINKDSVLLVEDMS